jgi:hypothetical protein
MPMKKTQAIFVVAALAFCASSHAALIVYEGFDYTADTSILGATGGEGWTGAWRKTGNALASETATSPGLTYDDLIVEGNKVTLTAQQNNAGANGNNVFTFRDTSVFGTDETELWISFIGQRTGDKGGDPLTYQRVFTLAFFNGADNVEMFSIGELSNDPLDVWNLNPTTAVAESQPTTVPIDTESFLLLKIVYGVGGVDTGYLWANYDISLGEPNIATANATIIDDMTFDRLRLSAGGSQNTGATLAASGLMDEIRMGDTFADVAPIPEPATLAMALTGLALAIGWRSGRRRSA